MDTPFIQDQGIYGSQALLIPCHIQRYNHWILLARITIENGSHKMLLFDSLDASNGQKQRKRITMQMKNYSFFGVRKGNRL